MTRPTRRAYALLGSIPGLATTNRRRERHSYETTMAKKKSTPATENVDAEPVAASVKEDAHPEASAAPAEANVSEVVEATPAKVHPLLGETVLYTLPPDERLRDRSHGDVRPAIVVRVWSDTCVNLQVLLDGYNDLHDSLSDERYSAGHLVALGRRTSVLLDPTGRPGSWRPRA